MGQEKEALLERYINFIEQKLSFPLSYKGNFSDYLFSYLDDYKQGVFELGGMSNEEFDKLEGVIEGIKKAVDEYYQGQPAKAYSSIEKGLRLITDEMNSHLESLNADKLYRLRTCEDGNSNEYSREEMFHIPFHLRTLVATQRYSIPGLPSIYLGSSAYVCWEELGRPNFSNLKISMYRKTSDLRIIDFGIPPSQIVDYGRNQDAIQREGIDKMLKEINIYLIIWPLIAACSVKVKEKKHTFKPEYILPQLVLQYVTTNEYDGIRYLSVNNSFQQTDYRLLHNYVFPAKTTLSNGHCTELKKCFQLTRGIPWSIYEIYKGTPSGLPPGETGLRLLRVGFEGSPLLRYGDTDFGRFERFLEDKVERDYIL